MGGRLGLDEPRLHGGLDLDSRCLMGGKRETDGFQSVSYKIAVFDS